MTEENKEVKEAVEQEKKGIDLSVMSPVELKALIYDVSQEQARHAEAHGKLSKDIEIITGVLTKKMEVK